MNELEVLIALRGDTPDLDAMVLERLRRTEVIVLGSTTVPQGSKTDTLEMLHVTVPAGGGVDRVVLPVFTSLGFVTHVAAKHPEWAALKTVTVLGSALLAAKRPDAEIVLNPWSDGEFQLGAV